MQRPTKQTRAANAEEKVSAFQSWLKQRPCCVSGRTDATEVHHMYGSAFRHNKLLIGHLACIPLHYDFHRGANGIHTISKPVWVDAHNRQAYYFDKEVAAYEEETGTEVPWQEYLAIMGWGR